MKELDFDTCRTRYVLMKQLQLLWRTVMVIAAVFLINGNAFSQGDAPDLPDPDRCVAQDLLATEARLVGDYPCYTCEEGNEILSTLELTINNKTGSVRTSVAFWATLEITDPDGNVTESYITGCTGPLSGSEYEAFGFDKISYKCGDALKLKHIYLAWTDASEGDRNQCPLESSAIAPKCKAQGDLIIIPPLSARVQAFEKPCVGETNGSIEVFAQGGSGIYTYTLNPGSITNSTGVFTDLGEGNYTIRIDDQEECFTEIEFELGSQVCCVPPTLTAQPGNESVCEGESASFAVTYTGGEPAPAIQWQVSTDGGTTWANVENGGAYSGATTSTLNISATTEAMNGNQYRAELISGTCDAVYSESAELVVNKFPDAPTLVAVQPTCELATGTITITSPTAGLEYSVNGAAYAAYPTGGWPGLVPGTYEITARNAAGCVSAVATVVINAQPATPAAPTVTVVQPTCAVATGSITVTGPVGEDYEYSINDEDDWQTGVLFAELAAGDYTIWVRNAAGCMAESATITINPQPATPATPVLAVVNPTCVVATGTLQITSATAGLVFSVNGGAYTAYPAGGWAGLEAGDYEVVARNEAECVSAVAEITIEAQPATPAAPTLVAVQPTCVLATGTITIDSDTDNLEFSVNGAAYAAYPAGGWAGLAAGTYTVTARNEGGCVSAAAIIVINPQPATPAAPTVTVVQPTCARGASITVNTPEGEGYEFSIDAGVSWQDERLFANLSAGTYAVAVRNDAGCVSSTTQVTINPIPDAPAAPVVQVTQPTCIEPSATIVITSSTEGLLFSFNGGAYAAYPTGGYEVETAGTYTISAINAAECESGNVRIVVYPQPATPATPAIIVAHPTCAVATGSVTVTAPTGEGYEYSINDGDDWQTGTVFAGLAAGDYTIWVRNAAGCMAESAAIAINPQPATPVAPTLTVTQPTCITAGSITVTAPTGTGLEYSINDGDTWQSGSVFANVGAGTYTIWVRNAAGCMAESPEVTVNPVPDAPAAPSVHVTQPTCTSETAMITITSGTEGLMFSINGGAFGAYPAGGWSVTVAGEYSIVARNAAMCVSGATRVRVNSQPTAPAAPTARVVQPTCTIVTGTITVTAPLGEGVMYSLNGGAYQTSVTFGDLMPGTYTLTARNAAGCVSGRTSVVVNNQPDVPTPVVTCETSGFSYEEYEKGLVTVMHTSYGPVGVTGRKRNPDGTYAFGNYAALFDTQTPTGDDTDLYTTDWGLALIINQDQTNVPNDNQWGGELILNFAAIGPVTMQSLKALDIDGYENMSWIYLYDAAGNELHKVELQNLGDNSKQDVDLGNTRGVMTMKVVLDGRNDMDQLAGSGAIDEIEFCVEETGSNCQTAGFPYQDHDRGLITMFHTQFGDVNVIGRKRNADGTFASGNYAALFDTQDPTGDDTDLYTTDWGLALIINQDQTNVPNDNQHGGELLLDFSNIGPVTMESLKALDIDIYSNNAWVFLYDADGNELYKVQLRNLGDNTKQDVDLGGTRGVMSMKVVFDGRDALGSITGSGAIDEIRFCVESPCVDLAQNDDESDEIESVSIMDAKAYPTPFQDRTTIEFRTRETEDYVVNLYDIKGMLIKQLKAGTSVAGELNTIEVDGNNLAEGMYLAQVASSSGSKTIKLILKR